MNCPGVHHLFKIDEDNTFIKGVLLERSQQQPFLIKYYNVIISPKIKNKKGQVYKREERLMTADTNR